MTRAAARSGLPLSPSQAVACICRLKVTHTRLDSCICSLSWPPQYTSLPHQLWLIEPLPALQIRENADERSYHHGYEQVGCPCREEPPQQMHLGYRPAIPRCAAGAKNRHLQVCWLLIRKHYSCLRCANSPTAVMCNMTTHAAKHTQA
jgi:hypothetical protein